MRQAEIFFKGEKAGLITQQDDGSFAYKYDDLWMLDNSKPPISLTLPKDKKEYKSDYLFPFFYNMLPEGANKQAVCKHMRIDNDDYFSLLLITARYDTIGAVTVKKI
ncbi:MAG: phosphatidylinositol kinase [Prolixibacteraceae bacterium]|jgi:HipA-like protein|nr:phosphatidylinositol kinase [Prolixibacteraceae bacterium]MBT6004949.1 phosphatidylinositol kinase [Prolixibacteraceae bacterium]MBT6763808.1 phosphatidylinositol kinase [Prolixibacteraceae bacterium]MBT7393851.1 phosphatidylinositol kinase [Prolixibacteraceae bacterium]